MSGSVRPRAALVPLARLAEAGVNQDLMALSGALVSVREAEPTHLLVVAEELGARCAARLLTSAGVDLLYGRADSDVLAADLGANADDGAVGGAPDGGVFRILRRGSTSVLRVPKAAFRPVHSLVVGTWRGAVRPAAAGTAPALALALVRTARRAATEASFLPAARLAEVDDALDRCPPDRWNGVAFALRREGAFLVGPPERELAAPGAILFWRAGAAEDGAAVYAPLGHAPEPRLAGALLFRALGGRAGHHLFWLPTPMVAQVPVTDLRPLARRAWRAACGTVAGRVT